MLSVAREINISEKDVVCRRCAWEGAGCRLSTGLIRITQAVAYLYAYRCPACGSFDVTRKGKLLEFRSPRTLNRELEDATMRERDSHD
jgi:hypothetical protein